MIVDGTEDDDLDETEEGREKAQKTKIKKVGKIGERDDSNIVFKADFRDSELPPGVEVVNGPSQPDERSEFCIQRDGSTAFKLAAGSYLKLAMSTNGVGGKLINDYTLTMDVMFDTLPSESSSLFQAAGAPIDKFTLNINLIFKILVIVGDPAHLTEGEAFVYAGGGVGEGQKNPQAYELSITIVSITSYW